jgi:hypothetical protein
MFPDDVIYPLKRLATLDTNTQPIGLAQALRRLRRGLNTVLDGGNAPVIDEFFTAGHLQSGNEVLVGHEIALFGECASIIAEHMTSGDYPFAGHDSKAVDT